MSKPYICCMKERNQLSRKRWPSYNVGYSKLTVNPFKTVIHGYVIEDVNLPKDHISFIILERMLQNF